MTRGLAKKGLKMQPVRHEFNPFTSDMMVPVSAKQVRLSRLGSDQNVLINQETGEVQGTHITTYKKVDNEQFVKLFTSNIAMTFELKAAGIKAFNVLMWVVQNKAVEKDLVPLDKLILDEFVKVHSERKIIIKTFSMATFWRGLAELEKAKIIAKHLRQGWYYINPNFCFNGDRIAFTTMIEKKETAEINQQSLPL